MAEETEILPQIFKGVCLVPGFEVIFWHLNENVLIFRSAEHLHIPIGFRDPGFSILTFVVKPILLINSLTLYKNVRSL